MSIPANILQVSKSQVGDCAHCGGKIVWLKSQRTGKSYPCDPMDPKAVTPADKRTWLAVDKTAFHSCHGVRLPKPPVGYHLPGMQPAPSEADRKLAKAMPRIAAALMTFITDTTIRPFLRDCCPEALEMAEMALADGGLIPAPGGPLAASTVPPPPAVPPPGVEYPALDDHERDLVQELDRMYNMPSNDPNPDTPDTPVSDDEYDRDPIIIVDQLTDAAAGILDDVLTRTEHDRRRRLRNGGGK